MRTLLVSAALLVAFGIGSSRLLLAYEPVTPKEPSVDELLNELERLQAQKAELEKKEKELKATLRKKLEQQSERLQKLGVIAKEPDRVGRIIIQGNTKTPDEKILEKLDLRPGQILQYPAIEASRLKLAKLGFRSVTVEVVPSELDSPFKDIRVTVEETKPVQP